MKCIIPYLLIVWLVSIFITIADKSAARRHKRRVSEKSLFAVSLIGGALPMYLTMLAIRHKTRHKRFMYGLPLIIITQLVAVSACLCYFR